ncbi:MAG: hypothetical protein NWF07_01635 [Candidatus Bathyarchaeota archaeon]|nr:hypothetical protein [Candidatus Bathyarchaeota archaeon]
MKYCPLCGKAQSDTNTRCIGCGRTFDVEVVKTNDIKSNEEENDNLEVLYREFGTVRYKRGRKNDNSRTYIIRYYLEDKTEKEIRVSEWSDTDTSFHRGDKIYVSKLKKKKTLYFIVDNLTIEAKVVGWAK